jgi:hypothetical protein
MFGRFSTKNRFTEKSGLLNTVRSVSSHTKAKRNKHSASDPAAKERCYRHIKMFIEQQEVIPAPHLVLEYLLSQYIKLSKKQLYSTARHLGVAENIKYIINNEKGEVLFDDASFSKRMAALLNELKIEKLKSNGGFATILTVFLSFYPHYIKDIDTKFIDHISPSPFLFSPTNFSTYLLSLLDHMESIINQEFILKFTAHITAVDAPHYVEKVIKKFDDKKIDSMARIMDFLVPITNAHVTIVKERVVSWLLSLLNSDDENISSMALYGLTQLANILSQDLITSIIHSVLITNTHKFHDSVRASMLDKLSLGLDLDNVAAKKLFIEFYLTENTLSNCNISGYINNIALSLEQADKRWISEWFINSLEDKGATEQKIIDTVDAMKLYAFHLEKKYLEKILFKFIELLQSENKEIVENVLLALAKQYIVVAEEQTLAKIIDELIKILSQYPVDSSSHHIAITALTKVADKVPYEFRKNLSNAIFKSFENGKCDIYTINRAIKLYIPDVLDKIIDKVIAIVQSGIILMSKREILFLKHIACDDNNRLHRKKIVACLMQLTESSQWGAQREAFFALIDIPHVNLPNVFKLIYSIYTQQDLWPFISPSLAEKLISSPHGHKLKPYLLLMLSQQNSDNDKTIIRGNLAKLHYDYSSKLNNSKKNSIESKPQVELVSFKQRR